MIDLAACKARGVLVTNVPAASIESVSEHAIALFFALRRNVVAMHELTVRTDEYVQKYSLKNDFGGCPGTCREEVVGIFGGGPLGMFSSSTPSLPLSIFFKNPLPQQKQGGGNDMKSISREIMILADNIPRKPRRNHLPRPRHDRPIRRLQEPPSLTNTPRKSPIH
jgi:hypothetical protein